MAEKKKILYIVEAMGGGVFTYIVELANELVNKYDMYIAYAVRKQTPKNYKDYFDKRIHLIEVKNFGRAIDPAKDIAAFFEVKKIAAKIKPENVKKADLTIADFWGINDVAPEMNDGNGTSLILIRTDAGRKIFEKITADFQLKEVSYEDGVRSNPAEYKSCDRPMQRNTFFDDMQSMSFEELEKKYAAPIKVPFKTRVKRKMKNTIKSMLQVIGGGREYKHNEEYGLLFVFRV